MRETGAMLWNVREYIQRWLKIVDKEGRTVPLRLNPPQLRLYEAIRAQWQAGKSVRIIILKARQMGFSTLTEAVGFALAATSENLQVRVVAHTDKATAGLYRMSRRYYEHLPEPLRPMLQASNAQELVFDRPAKQKGSERGLGSRIQCATAGGKGVGRGDTIQFLHLSEFAFWPGDKMETYTGMAQAVPDRPGTVIVIESTANGYNEFKKLWDDAVKAQREGTEGFTPIFFPWFEMPDYRRAVPPGFQRTQEEEELAGRFGLDDEQLAWRRWCIKANCGGEVEVFHQEYPSTPDEAFLSTGQCVFDKAALVARREMVQKDLWERGEFDVTRDGDRRIVSWVWRPDPKGAIRIRKGPQRGVPYVFGGDTAGTGSDYFAGHVLDNRTGEQVAVLHHQFGERRFAEQVYCLGMHYNQALVGVETNYSTYPEMVLEELGYPNIYVRQRMDTVTKRMVDAYGFETTPATRPLLVDALKDVARNSPELITDFETMGEMLTFVYDKNWKPQADAGEHDDLVISLGIAHMIRGQQSRQGPEAKKKWAQWTRDMYEDYANATEDQRRMLLKRWGRPRDL